MQLFTLDQLTKKNTLKPTSFTPTENDTKYV